MAERPTDPPSTGQSLTGGREDTVVRSLPNAEPLNGEARTDGKVMPPMPTNGQASTKAQSRPTRAPATPPSSRAVEQPTVETAVPSQRRTASPKPSGPPPQARVAATPPAPTPVAPGGPVSPPSAAPADRQAQPKRVKEKAQKAFRSAKPSRQERRTEKPAAAPRPGRRARLRMTRIDPWSVLKTSFLLSIALGVVTVVAVLMVWSVLGAADVWASINQTVQDVVGGEDASNFDIEDYIGTRRVVGFTIIVAAFNVFFLTAIATLSAFLYNMSASLLGGIEVTLAEDS